MPPPPPVEKAGLLDGFNQVRVVPDTYAALPAIEAHRSAVVDAKVEPASSPEQARGPIELTWPDGTVLRVVDDDSPSALRTILASLDRRS